MSLLIRDAVKMLQANCPSGRLLESVLPDGSLMGCSSAVELLARLYDAGPAAHPHRASLLSAVQSDLGRSSELSESMAEALEALRSGCEIIVVAHQPTMLSYTGVFAQLLLGHHLAQEMTQRGTRTILLYLCLDTDDPFDRRIRSTRIPMPSSPRGSLSLSVPVGREFRGSIQSRVPPPTELVLTEWCDKLMGAIGLCVSLAPRNRRELFRSRDRAISRLSILFRSALLSSANFADFARSMLLTFIEDVSGHATLMVRLSSLAKKCQEVLFEGFERWPAIRSCAALALEQLDEVNIVPKSQGLLRTDAAWLVCATCSRRNAASAESLLAGADAGGIAPCTGCSSSLGFTAGSLVMPRVLLEDLFTVIATDALLVLTYAGSADHVMLSQWTVPLVAGRPSPIFTWHPTHELNSALVRAARESLNNPARTREAQATVQLANGGRDSMVHTLTLESLRAYGTSWRDQFQSKPLDEPLRTSGSELT